MLLASQKPADGYLTLATSQAVSLNTTQLGISLVISLAALIFLVTVVKLHPFVSLLDAALVVGILNNAMTMMHAGSMITILLIIVIAAGSIFLSHLNDADFPLIQKHFDLSVGETMKTWSVLKCLLSVMIPVMIVSLFEPLTA